MKFAYHNDKLIVKTIGTAVRKGEKMRIFKHRPLALGCFLFIACMYLGYFLGNVFDIVLTVLSALALVATTLVAIIKRKSDTVLKTVIKLLPTCVCLLICGICALTSFEADRKIAQKYENTDVVAEILVTDVRYSMPYETTVIGELEIDGDKLKIPVTLPKNEIEIGDKIKASVSLYPFADGEKIGYSEKDFYAEKGMLLFGEAEEYELVSRNNFVLSAVFTKINNFLSSHLQKCVNNDTYTLLSAMLLGNKDALADNVRRDFSRLGISHILALSGIHISLLTSMAYGFLDLLRVRKSIKYTVLVAIIISFTAVTGFSQSAIRAGLMLIIFYILSFFGFRRDGVTSLFVAVFLICALDPYSIMSTSLILSFLAMLGCIASSYFSRRIKIFRKIKPRLLKNTVFSLISSITIMIFTMPIMIIKFDNVSVFAPFFNIIFVPLLTLLLYFGPFILLIGSVPYASYIFTLPAELITSLALKMSSKIATADFLTLSFTTPAHAIGICVAILAVILFFALDKRKIKYSALTLALGIVIMAGASTYTVISRNNTVSITAYDNRASDIVAVESGNDIMIIEVSAPSTTTMKMSSALASHLGYSDIDLYVMTDYSYRAGVAFDALTDETIVRRVMLPTPETEQEAEQCAIIEQIASKKGVLLEILPNGCENIAFNDTFLDIMEYERVGISVKRCVSFSISTDNERFTYLGASSYECVSKFPEAYAKASDVLLFGSYGPPYHEKFKFDLENADYLVFHGKSAEFFDGEIPQEKLRPHMTKFVFR